MENDTGKEAVRHLQTLIAREAGERLKQAYEAGMSAIVNLMRCIDKPSVRSEIKND